MNTLRSLLHAALLAAVVALGLAGPALAQQQSDPDNPEANATWQQMRTTMFQDRAITTPADAVLTLEAPERAQDAAIVPISIRTHVEQRPERYIERVYLMIDNNPSPMGATFHFTPTSGRADIETRVRIDAYTHVRAIAEMNTGELYMATRFVKASGGCSAPPGKDMTAAMASLGKMRFRVEGEVEPGKPALAQLMISHPNNSAWSWTSSRACTPQPTSCAASRSATPASRC
jgi:Predicted secreted protein